MSEQEATEHTLFRQAVRAFKEGDRETARQLMSRSLREDPKHAPAWLWMSGLVDDPNRQRECLERALVLDPTCEPARRGLELLRLQEVALSMPQPEPFHAVDSATDGGHGAARMLGEYLIERGLISVPQLERALVEQKKLQKSYQGARVPLGDVFIKLGMLTPEKLAMVLVEQQHDKTSGGHSPEYLGEYLVSKGIITQRQLEEVLAAQIKLRQTGRKILLGDLLIRASYITPNALETVLEQQSTDVFRRFGFDDGD